MKVVKICEEVIKPSSATPDELREHKISFIDEIIPHSSIPLILFYKKSETVTQSQICRHLKTSLSQTLTQFYPLAGRMKSPCSIDCNDEGVYYQETQVDGSVFDIVKNPKSSELVKLTPYNSDGTSSNFQELLAVQVNLFDCGGIAVSISMTHKIGDASSLCTFIKNWCDASEGLRNNRCGADSFEGSDTPPPVFLKNPSDIGNNKVKKDSTFISLGLSNNKCSADSCQIRQEYTTFEGSDTLPPVFLENPSDIGNNKVKKDSTFISLSSIFPPRGTTDDTPDKKCVAIQPVAEKLAVKRFVFTAPNIAKMKSKLMNYGYNENATRVEVVSALLWKCFMVAKGCNSVVVIPMNVRQRIVPPLPESSFGNFFLITNAIASVGDNWLSMVGKIKSAIGRIAGNYMEKIRGEGGFEFVKSNFNQLGKLIMSQGSHVRVLTIGSWCNFPINEANFGWGESILKVVAIVGVKDNVVLLDSAEFAGGIEAWAIMTDEELTLFEQDKDLQEFTSLDVICDLD